MTKVTKYTEEIITQKQDFHLFYQFMIHFLRKHSEYGILIQKPTFQ